jgi:hypothetical protein
VHFGEGEYEETEDAIRTLLAEAGRDRLGERSEATTQSHMPRATPETYLGAARAERFVNGPLTPGEHDFETGGMELPPDHLALGGRWRITPHSATAGRDASLHLNFYARRVFLVLGSPGREREVRVLVDGKPVRTVRVKRQRLYTLVELDKAGRHTLELRPEPGVQGYAFTFG